MPKSHKGDGYAIEFDTGGNDFITLDKSNMTLEIEPTAAPGVYTVLVRLTDDDELIPQTDEYKFIIIVSE